jgi:hypothetical protein
MKDELSSKQMKMVLEGKDIKVSLPRESGYHYLEENWTRYTLEEQMMIRKWIRFMFSKSKRINYTASSYGLKHCCESDVGFYVHNDAIKKAFLLEGFEAETGKINWYFKRNGKCTLKKSEKFREIFKEERRNEYN